jgi:hypothetical protein
MNSTAALINKWMLTWMVDEGLGSVIQGEVQVQRCTNQNLTFVAINGHPEKLCCGD